MEMSHDADYWKDRLGLLPHPEGGYYKVTYEAKDMVRHPRVPAERRASTGIYFLIDSPENFSAFHRIQSDEMWHFYAGDELTVHVITPEGTYSPIRLGPAHGFQAVVPAGCWFSSGVERAGAWALVGCTVAPGFDFADFELASRKGLTAMYPQHRDLIAQFTRV
jgi:uncharacterized protein